VTLPSYGKGRNLTGVRGRLFGGWEISAIVNLQFELPLAVSQATNFNAFAGFGTQRPNRIGNPSLPESQKSVGRYFETSAFTVAPQFTLGTSSRNPVRGLAYRNLDLDLIKRTILFERLNLEFRAEAFKVTNTPPLGNPNVVLGTPGFGSITSAGDPRVIQFGVKIHLGVATLSRSCWRGDPLNLRENFEKGNSTKTFVFSPVAFRQSANYPNDR
jgi:hypothetical protein